MFSGIREKNNFIEKNIELNPDIKGDIGDVLKWLEHKNIIIIIWNLKI